ncbi:MAG: hypothetical protein JSS62_04860 [Verrucomicrobia bacterium]|nr:hypothetical protein [Verrucomicrobiota bacterium]MBS0646751.1 hypothetical protein [Verrucomicrobiota bacterium]
MVRRNTKHAIALSLIQAVSSLYAEEWASGALPSSVDQRLQISSEEHTYFSEELKPSAEGLQVGPYLEDSKPKVSICTQLTQEGKWQLIFNFPSAVSVDVQAEGSRVYLDFNQGVDSQDLVQVQQQMGTLIKRISTGYHRLEFFFQRPVEIESYVVDKTFELSVAPDLEICQTPTRDAKFSLARLFMEERWYAKTACYLKQLEKEYPCHPNLRVLEATLENLLPRWQRSYAILRDLNEQYPYQDDFRRLMYDVYCPHAPYALAQEQYQRTIGLARVYLTSFQAEARVSCSACAFNYVGGIFQPWYGRFTNIVYSDGTLAPFQSERNQGTLYARRELESGVSMSALMYAQDSTLGGGAKLGYLWTAIQGHVLLEANWHRPCWEVFEAYAFQGREDAFRVEVDAVLNRYLNVAGKGGMRRVGITGVPNGYISALSSADVFWNLKLLHPQLTLNYGLDGEYIIYEKQSIGSNGEPFTPVPYQTFEYHSLRLYLYHSVRDRLFLMMYGGETINRYGGMMAPTYGIDLRYVKPCPCGLEIDLSAYRFPSLIVSGATSDYYTAMITLRF